MSPLQLFALAVAAVLLAAVLVLLLTSCGGGDPLPESSTQPVNCTTPGACT